MNRGLGQPQLNVRPLQPRFPKKPHHRSALRQVVHAFVLSLRPDSSYISAEDVACLRLHASNVFVLEMERGESGRGRPWVFAATTAPPMSSARAHPLQGMQGMRQCAASGNRQH